MILLIDTRKKKNVWEKLRKEKQPQARGERSKRPPSSSPPAVQPAVQLAVQPAKENSIVVE